MRSIEDLIHPDDVEADPACRERLLSGEIDTYSTERRSCEKAVASSGARSTGAGPRSGRQPAAFVGIVRDITAQHKAEAEVRVLTAELEARVKQRTAELER